MGFGRCDKYINPGLFYEIGRLEKFFALRERGRGVAFKHALLAPQAISMGDAQWLALTAAGIWQNSVALIPSLPVSLSPSRLAKCFFAGLEKVLNASCILTAGPSVFAFVHDGNKHHPRKSLYTYNFSVISPMR